MKRLPGPTQTGSAGLSRRPTPAPIPLKIADLNSLNEIDWSAVHAREWRLCKEGKQAEFLIEHQFPWELVSRIGALSQHLSQQVGKALQSAKHKPSVTGKPDWYY